MSHDDRYAERARCEKCGGMGWLLEMRSYPVVAKVGPSGHVSTRKPRLLCPECYRWVGENRHTGLKAPNE